MNSLELMDRILAELRCNDVNALDTAYNSGLYRAVRIIRAHTKGDIEYCPRCEGIARLFEKREVDG